MGISEWIDESTPDRREETVCFDRRLVSELVQAKRDLDDARKAAEGMLRQPEAEAMADRVAELEDQVREKSRVLVFEAIGWGAWRDLVGKHPPAPDQSSTFTRAVQLAFMPHAVENISYNAETFIPAAIAASCVEPGMTAHEASTFLRKAPTGVIERVWSAVLDVNHAGADDPFIPAASAATSAEALPSGRK